MGIILPPIIWSIFKFCQLCPFKAAIFFPDPRCNPGSCIALGCLCLFQFGTVPQPFFILLWLCKMPLSLGLSDVWLAELPVSIWWTLRSGQAAADRRSPARAQPQGRSLGEAEGTREGTPQWKIPHLEDFLGSAPRKTGSVGTSPSPFPGNC